MLSSLLVAMLSGGFQGREKHGLAESKYQKLYCSCWSLLPLLVRLARVWLPLRDVRNVHRTRE